jgi:voltage-gated potassium channel Kch
MSGHTVVVGFGVTGVNAVRHLLDHGTDPTHLMVVDKKTKAVERAIAFGAGAILGDGTDRRLLARAVSKHTRRVVVAVVPDEAMGHALHDHARANWKA